MCEELTLYHSYENCMGYGLLPTPKMKPLRKAKWVHHPVIEIEHALNLAKKERKYTLLDESQLCDYTPGIHLSHLIHIYGEKIARISFDAEEKTKTSMQNDYSPRTKEIYSVLEENLHSAFVYAHLDARHAQEKQGKRPRLHRSRRNDGSVFPTYT